MTHASLSHFIISAEKFLLLLIRFIRSILPLILQSVLTGPIVQMSVFHNGLTEFLFLLPSSSSYYLWGHISQRVLFGIR
jgi:hypothetical protein